MPAKLTTQQSFGQKIAQVFINQFFKKNINIGFVHFNSDFVHFSTMGLALPRTAWNFCPKPLP